MKRLLCLPNEQNAAFGNRRDAVAVEPTVFNIAAIEDEQLHDKSRASGRTQLSRPSSSYSCPWQSISITDTSCAEEGS
jgi:hypothetical protein